MRYYFLVLFLLFSGCSYKTTPIIFGFKKDNLAINDQGFLKENNFYKTIEVYSVGQLIFVMKIDKNSICINGKCYDKRIFIYNLNSNYPLNLFDLIISKQKLPNLKYYKTKDGFIQKDDKIFYLVTNNKVLFKDKNKKFIFLIKAIE